MDSRTRLTALGYTLALALTWELGTALFVSLPQYLSLYHTDLLARLLGELKAMLSVKCLGWALHLAEDFEVNCVFLKQSREPDQGN